MKTNAELSAAWREQTRRQIEALKRMRRSYRNAPDRDDATNEIIDQIRSEYVYLLGRLDVLNTMIDYPQIMAMDCQIERIESAE